MPSESDVRVVDDGIIEIYSAFDDTETATNAILRGLATLEGVPESDLTPLYEYVEPTALNSLLQHAQRDGRYVGVEFTIGTYTVVVNSNGPIRIHDGEPVTDDAMPDAE